MHHLAAWTSQATLMVGDRLAAQRLASGKPLEKAVLQDAPGVGASSVVLACRMPVCGAPADT